MPASSSRLQGDRYQHLYSWYELLPLLDAQPKYEYGVVENPGAEYADDITLHPLDAKESAKFTQVKFHVDHGTQYSFEYLIKVIPPSVTSLLEKLFQSWQKLRRSGPVEVWLVSNWAADAKVGNYITGSHGTIADKFYACTPRNKLGKLHNNIAQQLNTTDAELHEFFKVLRLRLAFAATSDLEQMVDDRMARYGLATGRTVQSAATDQVKRWIEDGTASKITASVMKKAISKLGLWKADDGIQWSGLWIHGWVKQQYPQGPVVELDWTENFNKDNRTIASQGTWEQRLVSELKSAKQTLDQMDAGRGKNIDLRGKLPLSIGLAIGAMFPRVGSYTIRSEQPTAGNVELWRSDARTTERKLVAKEISVNANKSDRLLISFSITGDATSDVKHLYDNDDRFRAYVDFSPDIGPGQSSISSNGDCCALAAQAKELLRKYQEKYQPSSIHIVPYCPLTFSLFVGQHLNSLGQVVTYERTATGEYQQSVVINTG